MLTSCSLKFFHLGVVLSLSGHIHQTHLLKAWFGHRNCVSKTSKLYTFTILKESTFRARNVYLIRSKLKLLKKLVELHSLDREIV